MQLFAISLRKNALVYTVKILTGSLIVWYGLRFVGFEEPYWAMISLIIVTEPDFAQAKVNFKARTINTFSGAVIACLMLVLLGPTLPSMLVALVLAVLVAMLIHNYPANWRLAPVTVVILMSAAFSGSNLHEELHMAILRVVEVLTGSTVALLQSLVYGKLVRHPDATPH